MSSPRFSLYYTAMASTFTPALFLFDIDGTLLESGTAVHREAFAHAFRRVYGLPLNLNGLSAAGRTDTWLLAEPLRRQGMSDQEIWRRMPLAFREMEVYVEQNLGDLRDRVLPGVHRTLECLSDRRHLLGLLTGNLSRIAMAKMRQAGLARFFDIGGFGEESEFRARLVPVALSAASREAGREIPPSRSVVIGDTPMDVEAGKFAGSRTVGVATGPYSIAELRGSGADLVLPSLADAKGSVEALIGLTL
jgi:phosphoglycolate phosphatase